MNNPFNITFGLEPVNYIKRIYESEKIINEFSSESPSNYVYLITGLRGSGKTVLLSRIASYYNENKDWVVVDPGSKENILESIASEIYENGKVKKIFLKSEFNFSFKGFTFSIEGSEPVSSATTLIKKMLDHLKKKKKRLLITIDEVDNSEQMKYFVQTYQYLLRLQYPVFLLMTGLYDNISNLQNDESITFLYRAPKINLEPLNIGAISYSYKKYLSIDDEKSLILAKLTKGYAYAYQVLGYLFYSNESKTINDDLLSEFDHYLSDYAYEKIYSELSNIEQKILSFFNDDKPIKISELVTKTDMDIKYLSVYRDRLIKKGIIFSPKYGYLELRLPRFYEFLKTK